MAKLKNIRVIEKFHCPQEDLKSVVKESVNKLMKPWVLVTLWQKEK